MSIGVTNQNCALLYRQTPLFRAVSDGSLDITRALIDAGADVNAYVSRGFTPLYAAAQLSSAEMTRLLITEGAVVNALQYGGITPLIAAATEGNADIVKVLLDAGAEVNATDRNGDTPLSWAVRAGAGRVDTVGKVKLLLSEGADPSTLHARNTPYLVS